MLKLSSRPLNKFSVPPFIKNIVLLFFVLGNTGTLATAQGVYDAHTRVKLISATQTVSPGQPFWVGIHMTMDPDWHVYWRNPGDSGLAPVLKWQLPVGFQVGEMQWPAPEIIFAGPLASYGYRQEVVFPVLVSPPRELENSTIDLKVAVTWLACEVPCLPGKADLQLKLKVDGVKQSLTADQDLLDKFLARVPMRDFQWTFWTEDNGSQFVLTALPPSTDNIAKIEFFPYDENILDHAAPQTVIETENHQAFKIVLAKNLRMVKVKDQQLSGLVKVHFAQDDSPRAIEVLCPIQDRGVAVTESYNNSGILALGMMLSFAFLGGVILNVMPCVFPVVSIKVLSFIRHAKDRRTLLQSAWGYVTGVVLTFIVLVVILIFVKATGHALGWGFQFQSPGFVTGMALFIFVMSLNFFGIFELNISSEIKPKDFQTQSFLASILTGILAVVVATPCTAPFMGTALSFALTQNILVNFLIFVFLGLGLSAPFVVLCLFPQFIKILPKPGPWMDIFKKFLGFPLLATVIWLLWVLAGQKGSDAVVMTLVAMLLISIGLWLLGLASFKKMKTGSQVVSLLLILVGIILPFQILGSNGKGSSSAPSSGWLNYDAAFIKKKEAEGQRIFIDFTARWCLTCQVNERMVLEHPQVVQAFVEQNIIRMKADWTNNDEQITKALAQLGKNSVPVYVLIDSSQEDRKIFILPEILTKDIVLEAIQR